MTMKKIIATLIAVTLLTGTFAGCSGSTNENEVTTTSKKVEETTTEAPTEEPTTEYVYKGFPVCFESGSLFANYFANRILNPGDKIVINEVCEQSLSPVERGEKVSIIITMIYSPFYHDLEMIFFNKYAIPGLGTYEFTYEENLVIEYEGDKPIKFEVVKEENGRVYIDFYLLD